MQMTEPAPKSQRVLVTGVAGFIGFHMASRLLGAGATVHGLDNLNAYYDVGLKRARLAQTAKHERFAFSQLDITDYDGLRALFADFRPDCVVHLAAQAGVRHSLDFPRDYVAANLDGFLSVLEACRAHPVRHLIYASSSSVYGANRKVPFHEDDPVLAPVSLYGATKRANELMAQTYAHLYRHPVLRACASSRCMGRGDAPTWPTTPSPRRSWRDAPSTCSTTGACSATSPTSTT